MASANISISPIYDITQTSAKVDVSLTSISFQSDGSTTNAGDIVEFGVTVSYSYESLLPAQGGGSFPSGGAVRFIVKTIFCGSASPFTCSAIPGYSGGSSFNFTVELPLPNNQFTPNYQNADIDVLAGISFVEWGTFPGTVLSPITYSNIEDFRYDSLPLSATFTKTDVTVNGGSDGTISIFASGGSGNYSYSWVDDPTTLSTRSNLQANNYQCTVTDTVTLEQVVLIITITEPNAIAEEPDPFLDIPKMQSIHFVVEETVDNCGIFQGFDNVLFCKQKHPFFKGLEYNQLFDQCDSFNVQVRSSYSDLLAKLINLSDGTEVGTFNPTFTEIFQGVGNEEAFDVRLQDNGSSQTRVYFVGSATIPLVLEVGDFFEISNSPNSIDGSYSVVSLNTDIVNGQQYIVINANYNSVNPSETAQAIFVRDNLPFNIYEFPVDFSSTLPGNYKIVIEAKNGAGTITLTAESEPISVAVQHENIIFIEWSNIDNAYGIDYSNNITHRIRVSGVLFDRLPSQDSKGIRTTRGQYRLLASRPRRRVRANFYKLPPYMHEKLSIIFQNDVIRVNGVAVVSEEGLEEPIYRIRYGLSSSSVILEQAVWFQNFNTDDPGGIDIPTEAFIIGNDEAFIKR